MIFFTADTHFNHIKCQQLWRTEFASLEDMNETLISRWNDRVSNGDLVYHLGDVALGSVEAARTILNRLNGQIYLIRGNHERVAERIAERFVWIKDYKRIQVGEQKICLLHYAMRTWHGAHRGVWHLYGHSHGSLVEESLSFDVGVDEWNYYPVSFEEVKTKMSGKRFEPVDHHTP